MQQTFSKGLTIRLHIMMDFFPPHDEIHIAVDNTDLSGNPLNHFPSVTEEWEADKLKCNMIPLRFL